MDLDQKLHKELDLLQGCINRMAHNSFLLKGWLITLLSAVFAIINKDANALNVFIGCILPTIIFWGLDAYFLQLERIYRKRYEWVLENRRPEGNLEMLYDLNPHHFHYDVEGILGVMFSKTLFPIYGTPLLIALFSEFYFFCCHCCCVIC